MAILKTLANVLTLGVSQARWGLSIEKPTVERRCRQAYRNAWFWYDGDDPPAADALPVERYAYSEREHWEAVMDELGIEYQDIAADER